MEIILCTTVVQVLVYIVNNNNNKIKKIRRDVPPIACTTGIYNNIM